MISGVLYCERGYQTQPGVKKGAKRRVQSLPALKKPGWLQPKPARRFTPTFVLPRVKNPLRVLRLASSGLSTENERSLRRFGKTIFFDLKIMAIPIPDTGNVVDHSGGFRLILNLAKIRFQSSHHNSEIHPVTRPLTSFLCKPFAAHSTKT